MKRTFAAMFLALALLLSVCSAETVETQSVPFAVENALVFSSPADIDDQNMNVFTDNEAVSADPVLLYVSAPRVSVSEADEEGYVVWLVEYEYSGTLTFRWSSSDAGDYMFGALYNLYDLFDYYTGMKLPYCDLTTSQDDPSAFYGTSTELEYNGLKYEISYNRSEVTDFGEWEYGDDCGSIAISSVSSMSIKVPADYDGLVIGINRGPAPESEDPFSGEEEEEGAVPMDLSSVADWTFIRLSDCI